MTIGQNLSTAESFRREALSLLAFVCRRDASWVIAHPEYKLDNKESRLFAKKLSQLKSGWPLAYLLEEKNFYKHSFTVSPAVLIPRPESEMIVEAALEYHQKKHYRQQIFLDLGTGSGALIISIAGHINNQEISKNSCCYFGASDISAAALKVAEINARKQRLKSKISFRRGDLLLPWRRYLQINRHSPLFIAANLPYLTPKEQAQEASIAYEPKLALIGGRDGLELYRRLLEQLASLKMSGPLFLMMEINPRQAPSLIKEAKKYWRPEYIQKKSDLSGRTRFIIINKS
ncbi:MAG: peptide chain release factor N(5)-glutamine methyltransferase [Patescibacteria group bacterium]|nr:peptide chain release factor N(5)-glutamine methyltransferase [Patescibacteria group bacterium]